MADIPQSPFRLATRLVGNIGSTIAAIDTPALHAGDRKTVEFIRRLLVDARLDCRDYELSETRDEQRDNAKKAVKRLEQLRALVLKASESDLFGPSEVAQLSAHIDEIIALLR